ncbi:MAG: hypothetical protein M3Y76_04205 [Chloroflexota bacterium]|nr:hypothetical protein [Chloroflexota bacterium]
MDDLCLTLLGPPEVCHADQVLLFSTREELAFFHCHCGEPGGVYAVVFEMRKERDFLCLNCRVNLAHL